MCNGLPGEGGRDGLPLELPVPELLKTSRAQSIGFGPAQENDLPPGLDLYHFIDI